MENAITKNSVELEQLENIIQKNIGAFYKVGRALAEIRDKGYYKKVLGFETFEEYCKARWDLRRTYAFYMIESAKVIDNVHNCEPIPTTESQCRPLTRLEPDKQREAWQKVIDIAPEGKITAALVSKVVRSMAPPSAPKTINAQSEDTDAVFQLKRWWDRANKKDKQIFKLWIEGGEK
jgi:hypothetical protein